METLILPTFAFILIAMIAYKQSRGFMSLPTVCILYWTFVYIGGMRLWLQVYSDTYLYVLAATASFVAGVAVTRAFQNPRSRPAEGKRQKSSDSAGSSFLSNVIARGRLGIRPQGTIAKQQQIDIGLHPKVFLYTLATLTLTSLGIWAYWIWIAGIPLMTSGNPSVGWVQSGAGAMNRLLGSLGGSNLVFLAFGWYALYKFRKDRLYLTLASGCLLASIFYMAFQGSKGSAVMTFLFYSVALFYLNRRTPGLKTFVLMGAVAAPITLWVASYYVSAAGQGPIAIIFNRMTTGELQGLDFLVQIWVPRYGLMHGHTFAMDIARIKAQFLGGPRPVVFHEYIKNLLEGAPAYKSTRLAESLTLFGLGYANYGLLGGSLFMMIFGGVCEAVDSALMTAKRIHFFAFIIAVYLANNLIAVLMGGDVLIIGLEALLIAILPKLFAFCVVYGIYALPFGIPYNWSKHSAKKRPSPPAGEIQANPGGHHPV